MRPADDKLIGQLRQLGDTTERWSAAQYPMHTSSWATIPVSLWWYRTGDHRRAADCARNTLVKDRSIAGACEATLRLILAMADFQSGQPNEARSELARARGIIDKGFKAGLSRHDERFGVWYDWVFARVLLREADALIGKQAPHPRLSAGNHSRGDKRGSAGGKRKKFPHHKKICRVLAADSAYQCITHLLSGREDFPNTSIQLQPPHP